MSTYATHEQLVARLSPGYTAPSEEDSAKLLVRASEIVNAQTQNYAELLWSGTDYADDEDYDASRTAITNATCDQVEYWLEVGPEHDVVGLRGSMIAGRVQVQNLPPVLGRRATQTLMVAGVLWAGGALQG